MPTSQAPRHVVLPPREQKAAAVRRMFGAIAPRYDLLNHLLSLNIDRLWRRRAVAELLRGREPAGTYLDACAGTLDLSVTLAGRQGFRGRVVASDFALPMLQHGRTKTTGRPISLACSDALQLPFRDAEFDGVMVAFGVRNLADLEDGLQELRRVLRPGGRAAILEFCTPRRQPFRALYLFYFRRVLPFIGSMISRHDTAYDYLPASVLEFPDPEELGRRMRSAGFETVKWFTLTGGIAAVHIGEAS
jgi:demethylmenaquinone methyltransferase/2-methoxy-6-polyprenyl-1,4-benzoquinol methylase